MGPLPKNVVMLTADAFGVLPPIARLTPDQAMLVVSLAKTSNLLFGGTADFQVAQAGDERPEAVAGAFSTRPPLIE